MPAGDYRLTFREARDVLARRLAEPPPGRIQLVAGPRQVGKTTLLLELAAHGRTVYDSMYVALAVRLNTRSITADDRLEAALKEIPAVAEHIQLVQTFECDVNEANARGE